MAGSGDGIPVFRHAAAGTGVNVVSVFCAGRGDCAGELPVMAQRAGGFRLTISADGTVAEVGAACRTGGGIGRPCTEGVVRLCGCDRAADGADLPVLVRVFGPVAALGVAVRGDHRLRLGDLRRARGITVILIAAGTVPVLNIARRGACRRICREVLKICMVARIDRDILRVISISAGAGILMRSLCRTGRRRYN